MRFILLIGEAFVCVLQSLLIGLLCSLMCLILIPAGLVLAWGLDKRGELMGRKAICDE